MVEKIKTTTSENDIMTWWDLVRKYFPEATDEECEYILWEKTAYPMGNVNTVEQHIKELANS